MKWIKLYNEAIDDPVSIYNGNYDEYGNLYGIHGLVEDESGAYMVWKGIKIQKEGFARFISCPYSHWEGHRDRGLWRAAHEDQRKFVAALNKCIKFFSVRHR